MEILTHFGNIWVPKHMIPSVRPTEEFLAEVQQALQANGPVVALRIQTQMGMTRQASATISHSCHN